MAANENAFETVRASRAPRGALGVPVPRQVRLTLGRRRATWIRRQARGVPTSSRTRSTRVGFWAEPRLDHTKERHVADNRLIIFDTTLRDGEQAPGFSMNTAEKLRLARQLKILGVDVLEAGFPIASSDDAEAVRLIAAEIKGPVIAALARCNQADIECASESMKSAERARIHTFIATSDLHLEMKLRISREDCLQAIVDNVSLARGYTDDVEFSAEDATRTDGDFLCRVVETAIASGATTINLPDTVGYCTPTRSSDSLPTLSAGCPTPTRRSSAPTVMTISGWRSRTRWRRCRQDAARSSARSTESASEPATRRSRDRHGHPGAGRQDALCNADRDDGALPHQSAAFELTSEPVQANKAMSVATPLPTRRVSTRTGCSRTGAPMRSCGRPTSVWHSPRWCWASTRDAMPLKHRCEQLGVEFKPARSRPGLSRGDRPCRQTENGRGHRPVGHRRAGVRPAGSNCEPVGRAKRPSLIR